MTATRGEDAAGGRGAKARSGRTARTSARAERSVPDGTAGRVSLLVGDAYLVGERLRALERDTVGEVPPLGAHEVLHGDRCDVEAIATAVKTFAPGGRRMVVLRQADRLKDDVQKAIVPLLDEIPESTFLVLTAESPDMRRTLFASLRDRGAVESLALGSARDPAATRRALLGLAERRAREIVLRISMEGLQALVDYVDNDPGRLVAELEKLSLRHGGAEVGVVEVLAGLGGDRALSAFALEGALRERRIGRVIVELRALLAQGDRPEMIVGQLAGEVRSLLRARALLDSGLDEDAAKRAFGGGRGWFVVPRARNFRRPELERALRDLARIDVAAKTGGGAIAARLEQWLLRLAPAQARA